MPRLLLLSLSLLLTTVVVCSGVLRAELPRPVAAASGVDPVTVLADWDERRAAAWAAGDAVALSGLYAPGAAAGRRDRAMLRAWTDRGLRVRGLALEVLDVVVVHAADDRLVLVVTDRVARGRAVGRGLDAPLPADGPTTDRVTLVQMAGEWRVAEVG